MMSLQKACYLFKDPGLLFALGNVFLFSLDGGLSFLIALITLLLCIFVKIRSQCDGSCPLARSSAPWAQATYRFIQQPSSPLFINGVGCLCLALLGLSARSALGFLCGLGFGLGNIKIARSMQSSCSASGCSCHFCRYLHPIVFIGIGMVSSGLLSGGLSLWALPFILFGILLALTGSIRGKAIHGVWPYLSIALASLWYTLIGGINHHYLATIANGLFTAGFLLLAKLELDEAA